MSISLKGDTIVRGMGKRINESPLSGKGRLIILKIKASLVVGGECRWFGS